jgi:hypothetical protein
MPVERVSPHDVPDRYVRDYQEKHWGNMPDFVYYVNDPRLPRFLPEMGKLQEIDVDVVHESGHVDPITIDFPDDDRCILCYDKYTHRIYLCYPEDVHREIADRLWVEGAPTYPLSTVARSTNGGRGRHAKPGRSMRQGKYPAVQVQNIGIMKAVVYFTHKKGHGPSRYVHGMGEDSKLHPDLCVSKDGQIWIAGGHYLVRKGGIED